MTLDTHLVNVMCQLSDHRQIVSRKFTAKVCPHMHKGKSDLAVKMSRSTKGHQLNKLGST